MAAPDLPRPLRRVPPRRGHRQGRDGHLDAADGVPGRERREELPPGQRLRLAGIITYVRGLPT